LIISQYICLGDSFTLNNISYKNTGTYFDTLKNISGCDSAIITLNITTSSVPKITILADSFCQNDTVFFNGIPITTQGLFYDTLRGNLNCDSIYYTLQTTLIQSYSDTVYHSICDNENFVFDGNTLNTAGIYYRNRLSPSGCDSIRVLFLTVNPTYYYYFDSTFCITDSIYLVNGIITNDGINQFRLLSNNGCDSIIEVNVLNNCPDNIFIPNTFTPNGDGLNDVFTPSLPDSIKSYQLLIFDRWGEIIFSTTDKNEGWDGSYIGEMVPNDIFIWKIRYTFTNETKIIIGHVLVNR